MPLQLVNFVSHSVQRLTTYFIWLMKQLGRSSLCVPFIQILIVSPLVLQLVSVPSCTYKSDPVYPETEQVIKEIITKLE